MDRYTADNLANRNERVPIHAASDTYAVDKLISDPDHLSSIVEFERDYLGDVSRQDTPRSTVPYRYRHADLGEARRRRL